MANYRRLGTQNTTDWLLMSPQSAWEALRMAWMLWRHPDKAAILIGSPAGWVDAHAQPVQVLREDAVKRREVGAQISEEYRSELEALATRAPEDRRQMMKDAERYRWLRESQQGSIRLDGSPDSPGDTRWAFPHYIHWADGALDAVIDAAMVRALAVCDA